MNNDRINEVYDGTFGSSYLQNRARRRIHWLCAQVKGERVLDGGCSQGIAALLLGREGRTVEAVDRERGAIEFAQQRLDQEEPEVRSRVRFTVCELTGLPFDSGSFDAVLLGEVLEHQIDPRPILSEAARVLRPEGVLALTTPYGHFPYHDHKEPIYLGDLLETLAESFVVAEISLLDAYLTISARPQTGRGRSIDWRSALAIAEQRVRAEEEAVATQKSVADKAKQTAAELREELASRDELAERLREDSSRLEQRLGEQGEGLREAIAELVDLREAVNALRTERASLRRALRDERAAAAKQAEHTRERHDRDAPPPGPVIARNGAGAVTLAPADAQIAVATPPARPEPRPNGATAPMPVEPTDAEGWMQLAKEVRDTDPERAVDAALRAVDGATDPSAALWVAADVLARTTDRVRFDKVVERLGPVKRLPDKDLRRFSNLTIQAGDFERTLAAAAELKRRTPNAPAATYATAVALWERGDEAAALSSAAPLWAEGATDVQLLAGIRFLLRINDVEQAQELLERLGEPHAHSYSSVGRRLRQEGHLFEALDAFDKALAADPDDRDVKDDQVLVMADLAAVEERWAPPAIPQRTATVPGRVLHLLARSTPHHLAGNTVRTHSIAKAQMRAGLDVHVVTEPGFPWAAGVKDAGLCDVVDGVQYHRLRNPGPVGSKALDERLCRHLHLASEFVEELRPAVLHPHSTYVNALVALELGRRFGIPVVYEVRGFPEERRWSPRHSRATIDSSATARRLEESCWRRADHVTTLAEVMKRHIVAAGVAAEKVTVVTNAIDPEEFAPAAPDAALKGRLGIPDAVPVVGYISTLAPYEGIQYLVRAVGHLRDRGVGVHCLLVGDGSEREMLEAEVDRLDLRDRVTFTGVVTHDDVPRYYGLIDVFVVPRTNEAVSNLVTPLKPYEAMAMERAVVMSKTTALSEMGIEGETARFFTPEDAESLTGVLQALAELPEERVQLARAGRTWVAEHRTWERNVAHYQEIYRHLGAI